MNTHMNTHISTNMNTSNSIKIKIEIKRKWYYYYTSLYELYNPYYETRNDTMDSKEHAEYIEHIEHIKTKDELKATCWGASIILLGAHIVYSEDRTLRNCGKCVFYNMDSCLPCELNINLYKFKTN